MQPELSESLQSPTQAIRIIAIPYDLAPRAIGTTAIPKDFAPPFYTSTHAAFPYRHDFSGECQHVLNASVRRPVLVNSKLTDQAFERPPIRAENEHRYPSSVLSHTAHRTRASSIVRMLAFRVTRVSEKKCELRNTNERVREKGYAV